MRLLPSGKHDGPKPVTPMIKVFVWLIVANAFGSVLLVAGLLVRSRMASQQWANPGGSAAGPRYLLFGFLAFDIILVGTFLLLNQISKNSE